jgi:hypothetical protein
MFWVVLLAFTPCHGGAPPTGFTLYDNFGSKIIDPDKWVGQQTETDSSHRVLRESVVEIDKNQLHLVARTWACKDCLNNDTGTQGGQSRLRALGALSSATSMQATVQVKQLAVAGSDVNQNPAQARARLVGWFFNDGTSTGPGDQTGDVFAWIGLRRKSDSTDAAGVMTIVGVVARCEDSTCSDSSTTETQPLGTVKYGPKTTLALDWDDGNQRFIFKWLSGKNATTAEITYAQAGVSNAAQRVNTANRLDVWSTVPNDNGTTGERPMAFMEAYFDDIYYK